MSNSPNDYYFNGSYFIIFFTSYVSYFSHVSSVMFRESKKNKLL